MGGGESLNVLADADVHGSMTLQDDFYSVNCEFQTIDSEVRRG